ncbi:MAG TPA: lysylphosphatidylglycerol synthase domain-containing protein [Candidatus Binatia bacterium]|nr:lysylphosphatidylglycerol synthase domain-containing protein [Candidatus Binatia bacterium]
MAGTAARALRRIAPWALTAAIFALLLAHVPVGGVIAALRGARWGWYLLLVLPYATAYFLIDTLAVTTVVRRFHTPVRYRDVLPVRAVTYLLALVNSNVGNGGLALWLHRREGIPFLAMAGSVLFLAFVEVYQLVLYSSLGVLAAGTSVPGLRDAYLALYALLAGWLAYFNGLRALGVARPAPGLLETFGRARLIDYLVILGIKSASLLMAIVVQHVGLHLFGMDVPLLVLLANLPLVFLVSAVPLTVAKLGTSQAAWILLLGAYAPAAGLLAYSLAAHALFLATNALIGLVFLPRAGREVWALAAEGRRRQAA